MASDIRFKQPFTCIIGGPTESGKSTFVYVFYTT
jgi:polynucleotide 5'-kinase involved in rRNA processing